MRPKDVITSDNATQKEIRRSANAQFWQYQHFAENIQHNFKDQEKKKNTLLEAGGARFLLSAKDEDGDPLLQRRRGPRKRIDDPVYGPTKRIEATIKRGQVTATDGETSNLKLVIPSKTRDGKGPRPENERHDEYERALILLLRKSGPRRLAREGVSWADMLLRRTDEVTHREGVPGPYETEFRQWLRDRMMPAAGVILSFFKIEDAYQRNRHRDYIFRYVTPDSASHLRSLVEE